MVRSAAFTFLLFLSSWFLVSAAFARFDEKSDQQSRNQSREVIQYGYDDAGNMVSVTRDVLQAPPTITAIDPNNVRIGVTTRVTLTGTNLANASITTDDSQLVVSATRATNSQVIVDITAKKGVREGNHKLTASTALGSASIEIIVQPQLPELLIAPVPLVIVDGESLPLQIALRTVDIKSHTFTLAVSDPLIASLSKGSLTIPVGHKTPDSPITVSGLAAGVATLTVSASDFGTSSLTIVVAPKIPLPEGTNYFYSSPLGMLLETPPEPPAIVNRGPFYNDLRLRKLIIDDVDDNQISPIVSRDIKVVRGSGIKRVSPLSLLADSGPTELVIHGMALGEVDSFAIAPNNGLTFGDISVDADSRAVRIPVTVDPDVPLSQRQVVLSVNDKAIAPLSVGADRFYIGGRPPVIDSIDPVTVSRGVTGTLTIRGQYLQQASAVTITPADDVILASQPSVNSSGTEVTVGISVVGSASPGDRVVTVTTPTGISSEVDSPANTLTIIRRSGDVITPIKAASLGVRKSVAIVTQQQRVGYAQSIGLSKGSVIHDLQPAARAVGSTFTLIIDGAGLQGVDNIGVIPDTGITVGAPIASPDGDRIMVNTTIESDAPATLRRVKLTRNGELIPVAIGGNNRFQVTAPMPVVESVSPNFLLTDNTPRLLTVRGQLLNNIQQLRIEPADGIIVNTPVVNSQGDTVTVEVTATETAAVGPRTIVVDTLGGSSDANPGPANTITLASDIDSVVEAIVSPAVGLKKRFTPPPTLLERTFQSTLTGINKPVDIDPVINQIDLQVRSVGISLGPVASHIMPTAASVDTSLTLTIEGMGLDNVTNVQVQPDTGITLGSIAVATDQIGLPVTVAADAPQTLRRVVLTTIDGALAFSDPVKGRLQIAGPPATIDSIEPIQQTPGANFTLLIRGANLRSAQSVSMLPADSRISIGTPSVNEAGTELRVQVNLSDTVNAGPRTVVVTTMAGSTSATATPANTFTVVNQ